MKLTVWAANIGKKKFIIIILILAVLGVLLWFFLGHTKSPVNKAITDNSPTNQELKNDQLNAASVDLNGKNYQQAALDYITAASLEAADNNFTGARSILDKGINKIPNNYLGWTYYEQLAAIDMQLNNRKSEISDLQTALNKAENNNGPASSSIIDSFKSKIQQLENENQNASQ